MKKIFFFIAISIIAVVLTSCQESIKLDSLSNTYWESTYDSQNYSKVWFYSNGECRYLIHAEGEDGVDYTLNWTCSASGYVDLSMTVWTTKKTIVSGYFNGDKCTLSLGKLDYDYKGKAK